MHGNFQSNVEKFTDTNCTKIHRQTHGRGQALTQTQTNIVKYINK